MMTCLGLPLFTVMKIPPGDGFRLFLVFDGRLPAFGLGDEFIQ